MWQIQGYYNRVWVLIDMGIDKRDALRRRRVYTRLYSTPHRIRKVRDN